MKKSKIIIAFLSIFLIMIGLFNLPTSTTNNANSIDVATNNYQDSVNAPSNVGKRIYLSDIDYITTNGWSYNGWKGHNIEYDKNQDGGSLSLQVNNQRRYFTKGLSIHAKGQITYDISKLSTTYPRFVAYLGVDASRGTKGDLWIKVSVSNDGENWQDLYKTDRMNGQTPAIEVDLSVENYKYLRIYVDPNGSNGADHGTIASASLVTKDFDKTSSYYNKLHTIDYYDSILKNYSVEENYSQNYRLVLERELVNKLGYSTINEFAEFNKNGIKTLDWYLAKNERIEQIIEVGEISNTSKFLNILADLYTQNETQFNSLDRLIYTKMAVGLAATYTTDPQHSSLRFGRFAATYDYVERYSLMKKLFDENKFMHIENNTREGNFVPNNWFEGLHVELIRMIMNDAISPEEIIWLNEYTHLKKTLNEFMIPYIHPNYNLAKLYDEANRDTYNSKYLLNQYGIPYADGKQRLWMVLEAGGICWNQSRFGQTMYHVNGIPAVGAYQPGHEMYFSYAEDDNGNGFWMERYGNYNDAGTTWYGGNGYRLIFNWGAKSFTNQNINDSNGGTSLGYLYLAQANLNNYQNYKKSLYYNLIANSYEDNNKKINTYFKALNINNINLDSYDYIINLYKQMSDKNDGGTITSDDWYNLALKVTKSYRYYPVAMFDLLKVIRPYLEGEKKLDIDRIEKEYLIEDTTISDEKLASIGAVNAGSGVRTHAKKLLGLAQPDPMSFSFDGENGGKIVKNPIYSLNFAYSLDGGLTYSNWTDNDDVTLTQNEIESITSENDIIVKFMGLKDYSFTIDITDGALPSNIYPNDLENRVIGASDTMEWRLQGSKNWTSFKDELPDLTGDKIVEVRTSFTKNKIASKPVTYVFTLDNQPDTAKYIPIEHLSIHSYSTESQDAGRPFYAPNAIDGNMTTLWHTDFKFDVRKDSIKPFLVIKLDEPRNVSALEFAQIKYKKNDPDYIKDAIVYVSSDGENWSEVGKLLGCSQENKLRRIDFEQSVYGQYVKIEMATHSMFASLAMVNLFENTTKNTNISPTAEVLYSTTSLTNQDVLVQLVNPSKEITITNNNGSNKYIFTENGSFTFEFVDAYGNKGTAIAKVDWIDKKAIKADIAYNINTKTNKDVIATIAFNKENVTVKGGNTHIFKENGEFTFEYVDKAGNKGTAKAKVNWVDKKVPIATISYDITTHTNQDVIATIKFDEEKVTVKGGNTHLFTENGEYTFEFVDEAGNKGTSIAQVNWIDKTLPKATITYDKNKLTNQNVTATITFDKENVIVTGGNTHTFIENGEYVFEFISPAGNKGTAIAKVNWIDKKVPTATISYSTPHSTNQDVIATIEFDEENVTVTGGNTHTFTENGEYTFEYVDAAGNRGVAKAQVNWIDRTLPKATITYDKNKLTNQNVTATITFDKENVMVTGGNTHTFTENGEYEFKFVGPAGNKGTAIAKVDWIDKKKAVPTITYSTINKTSEDVIATVTFDKEDVTVIGGNTHTFTENGEYVFDYVDRAGNKGTAIAIVSWIEKNVPIAEVEYNTTSLTNQDVIATIKFDKKVSFLTEGIYGEELANNTYKFKITENTDFILEYVDVLGNKGTTKIKVDWIDKIAPTAEIVYSNTIITTEDVIATLKNVSEDITITNNNESNKYIFTENGEFIFEFVDKAGNKGTAKAIVNNIDKTVPTATVITDIATPTNQNVTATLVNPSEEITITNNNGLDKFVFTKNGEFTFEFVDKAGNKGTATINVDWIIEKSDKPVENPIKDIVYSTSSPTNQDVTVTIKLDEGITITNNNGSNTYTFTENGTFVFEYVDKDGNVGKKEVTVDWIDKTKPVEQPVISPTKPSENTVINKDKNDVNKIDKNKENNTDKKEESKPADNEKPSNNSLDNETNKEVEKTLANKEENKSIKDGIIKLLLICLILLIIFYLLIKKSKDNEETK